jgi:hypothetical protein
LDVTKGGGTLGLFRFKLGTLDGGDGDCKEFDGDSEKDAALNCARVCAILALLFGAAILLFGFFKQCLCKLPCTQIIMDLSGLGVQISMALVYVAYANEICDNGGGCEWSTGMTFNLLAQICYIAASCLVRCMREPRYERRKNEQPARKSKKASKEETK